MTARVEHHRETADDDGRDQNPGTSLHVEVLHWKLSQTRLPAPRTGWSLSHLKRRRRQTHQCLPSARFIVTPYVRYSSQTPVRICQKPMSRRPPGHMPKLVGISVR